MKVNQLLSGAEEYKKLASKNGKIAYRYAQDNNTEFLDGEKAMLRDLDIFSLLGYAVIKNARWEKFEFYLEDLAERISEKKSSLQPSKLATVAAIYAVKIGKGKVKWTPTMESILKSSPKMWKHYEKNVLNV